jgi:hypothetical protein
MTVTRFTALLLTTALVLSSCEKEQKTSTPAGDAGLASEKPALDPSLAKAVAAAASGGAKSGKSRAGVDGGPPENGIFAPGAADKELAGAPFKISVGNNGSEPRVQLSNRQLPPGTKRNASLQLEVAMGPGQALPPLVLELGFAAQKAAEGATVSVSIAEIKLSDPRVPKEAIAAFIKQLKPSRIEYQTSASGAAAAFRYTMPKDADTAIEAIVHGIGDTIATMLVPFPEQPIGKGAVFMVTTREQGGPVEALAYRLFTVTDVKDDKVSLSVNTKRYATDRKFEMAGLPPDLGAVRLEEFQSGGEGTLELRSDSPFPSRAELSQSVNANLSVQKQPNQRAALQTQSRAMFTLQGGDAPRASATK